MPELTLALDRHHTQWAAQFAVASELCKRRCQVSFTMGDCSPLADLMVQGPSGQVFLVDVKGQSTRNFWRIKAKPQTPNLYYVLCYVGSSTENRFFPMSQATLAREMEDYRNRVRKYDPRFSRMNWGDARSYENRWDELPLEV